MICKNCKHPIVMINKGVYYHLGYTMYGNMRLRIVCEHPIDFEKGIYCTCDKPEPEGD